MATHNLATIAKYFKTPWKYLSRITTNHSPPTANFFWDGPRISLWSKACINSFKNNGFKVIIYSYSDTLQNEFTEEGITVVNAEEICEKSFRDKLFNAAKPGSYGKTYACFTDFFRLCLLSKRPGTWWFDTDVFCIKNAILFKQLEHSSPGLTICGNEDTLDAPVVNTCNAILWFSDKNFAKETFDNLVSSHPPFEEHEWAWAQTAIPYLNSVIQSHPHKFNIQKREVFYPLSWLPNEISIFMLPENADTARTHCEDSLTLHFWNEVFSRLDISRDQLPPEGSFLHKLIIENLSIGSSTGVLDAEQIRQKLSE